MTSTDNMNNMDEMVREMRTKSGFIRVFWIELQKARKEVPSYSRERVFNMLNDIYYSITGRERYASWNCFRSTLGRERPEPVDEAQNARMRNLRRTLLR